MTRTLMHTVAPYLTGHCNCDLVNYLASALPAERACKSEFPSGNSCHSGIDWLTDACGGSKLVSNDRGHYITPALFT